MSLPSFLICSLYVAIPNFSTFPICRQVPFLLSSQFVAEQIFIFFPICRREQSLGFLSTFPIRRSFNFNLPNMSPVLFHLILDFLLFVLYCHQVVVLLSYFIFVSGIINTSLPNISFLVFNKLHTYVISVSYFSVFFNFLCIMSYLLT